MDILHRTIDHIKEVAETPSFSSYEERLHPYIHEVFSDILGAENIDIPKNNIIYRIEGDRPVKPVALAAHLDKINHYGDISPVRLPVDSTGKHIEGAMDDSAGVGILLALAELTEYESLPDLLFFFSEMEESKGLKEHPELLKNNGKDYHHGMGAKRIAKYCVEQELIPGEVITIDTTPLFKGDPGIALYLKHWELNGLEPSSELIKQTGNIKDRFLSINENIKLANNTNDYLHYGKLFNLTGDQVVPSVALEPSIFPYHQKGERVFISDIYTILSILRNYLIASAE